jgi:nitroimidazol reductase NimA-like FMN-containing flavoprotein (pyridoxamine 5'-phosphate oxidase superfamily)
MSFTPTERTRVRRLPERGHYDRETVYPILDEAFICHIGFVAEGKPVVIPTLFGREGDKFYFHGSAASRMLRNLREGIDCCITITLVDGLVLARSGFHSSMNYRSVVIFGRASEVTDTEAKTHALAIVSEHLLPGRWADVRPPSEQELKGTTVLMLELDEVSAKIRTGGPKDDAEDYDLPVWAGILPLTPTYGTPEPDSARKKDEALPEYVRARTGKPRK